MIGRVRPYAKFVAAIVTAALAAIVQFAVPVPELVTKWLQLGVAVLGAIAVYAVPNASPEGEPQHAAEPGPFDE